MSGKITTNPAAIRSQKALALAFVELLGERPIERITIEEITGRAGLSRQTFYTNFSKKEEILEHSLHELFLMFLEEKGEPLANVGDMLSVYFQFWGEHQTFLTVLFQNRLSYIFAVENTRLFQNEYSGYAKKAARSEEERPFLESYLAGLTFQALRTWQQGGWEKGVDQVAEIARRLLKGRYFDEREG